MHKRVIKFRIWDIQKIQFYTEEWYPRPSIEDGDELYSTDYGFLFSGLDGLRESDRYVLQQFTGLSDKNNKEIYEGDILKHYPGFGCAWKERKSYVEYKECAFWECHRDKNNTGADFVLSDRDQSLEIIGNIFENSELLNNK